MKWKMKVYKQNLCKYSIQLVYFTKFFDHFQIFLMYNDHKWYLDNQLIIFYFTADTIEAVDL